MTDLEAEQPDLLGRLEHDMAREESSDRASAAASEISTLLNTDRQVGDLIRMDFGEAHVLVHDALRQQASGIPHGCLLLAARTQGLGDSGVETGEGGALAAASARSWEQRPPQRHRDAAGALPSRTTGF